MDTKAYLSRHGWLGNGHSLHLTGRGIKKPLLVSQKSNVWGIGKKKHDVHADQWWARAFDSSLKGLDISKNETTGATDSVKSGLCGTLDTVRVAGEKWVGKGGLYAGFVQGEGLSGTILEKTAIGRMEGQVGKKPNEAAAVRVLAKKRRRAVEEGEEDEEKRRQRQEIAAKIDVRANQDRNVNAASHPNVFPARLERDQQRRSRKIIRPTSGFLLHSATTANGIRDCKPRNTKRSEDENIITADMVERSGIQTKPVTSSTRLEGQASAFNSQASSEHKYATVSVKKEQNKRRK
ncbi:hypothetical protein MMC13_007880 [Lambiella insularis]|nr:hypothetical protein [Lambiella insularis]